MISSSDAELDLLVHQRIAPLFATDAVLRAGHTDASLNATVTFVQRSQKIFAVTCSHVISAFRSEALKKKVLLRPTLHLGHLLQSFGMPTAHGERWAFNSCRDFPTQDILDDERAREDFDRQYAAQPDIAIAPISRDTWDLMRGHRELQAIDLDSWTEPPWKDLEPHWAAYGFPDEHKSVASGKVAAPMPRIVAELQTLHPEDRTQFTLCSTLTNPHGYGFSGVSGGTVLAEAPGSRFHFVGIVFEGAPSSLKPSGDTQSFLGPQDIYLQCYRLTPAVFDEWLQLAKFGVEIPR